MTFGAAIRTMPNQVPAAGGPVYSLLGVAWAGEGATLFVSDARPIQRYNAGSIAIPRSISGSEEWTGGGENVTTGMTMTVYCAATDTTWTAPTTNSGILVGGGTAMMFTFSAATYPLGNALFAVDDVVDFTVEA
jgi:hypothetical protein